MKRTAAAILAILCLAWAINPAALAGELSFQEGEDDMHVCTTEGSEYASHRDGEGMCYDCRLGLCAGHIHVFQLVESMDPTCTEDGFKQYKCECGYGYIETIPAAHTMGEWTIVEKPACRKNGLQARSCAVCGDHKETREINSLGHDMKAVETVRPTYFASGYTQYRCSRCKATEKGNYTSAQLHILYGGTVNADGSYQLAAGSANRFFVVGSEIVSSGPALKFSIKRDSGTPASFNAGAPSVFTSKKEITLRYTSGITAGTYAITVTLTDASGNMGTWNETIVIKGETPRTGTNISLSLDETDAEAVRAGDMMRATTQDPTGSLNLRSAPTLAGSVVGSLQNGDSIRVTGKDAQFYRAITDMGDTVYASSDYLADVNLALNKVALQDIMRREETDKVVLPIAVSVGGLDSPDADDGAPGIESGEGLDLKNQIGGIELDEGDQAALLKVASGTQKLQMRLRDDQGGALAGMEMTVTVTKADTQASSSHSCTTDTSGAATLALQVGAGERLSVLAVFAGDETHRGASATLEIGGADEKLVNAAVGGALNQPHAVDDAQEALDARESIDIPADEAIAVENLTPEADKNANHGYIATVESAVQPGEDIYFQALPLEGYLLDSVAANLEAANGGAALYAAAVEGTLNAYRITVPQDASAEDRIQISASFKAAEEHKVGWILDEAAGRYTYWKDGTQVTGWVKDAGDWYFLDPLDGYLITGWFKDGRSWYYADPDTGIMCANQWIHTDNKWYYVNVSGEMETSKWVRTFDSAPWSWVGEDGAWERDR